MNEQSDPRSSTAPPNRRQFLRVTAGVGVAYTAGVSAAQETPTEITDWHDLDAVRDGLDGEYVLITDLDAETAGYDEHVGERENGWEPIGEPDWGVDEGRNAFSGTLDGNGHDIAALTIDRPESEYVGLFGAVSGTIQNVTVVDATVNASSHAGALAGELSGQITDSAVGGDVSGIAQIGGLVGVSGTERVGTLDGWNAGNVTDSTASTSVTGEDEVGGLVGTNGGAITGSAASGPVTGERQIGGLVGYNAEGEEIDTGSTTVNSGDSGTIVNSEDTGTIVDSEASGTVAGSEKTGGLVGENGSNVTVENSTATGNVTGTTTVGGLVGHNNEDGSVTGSTAAGDVTGDNWTGGLIGRNDGRVADSHYNIEEVQINGRHALTLGGLFPEQYRDWRARDGELSAAEYDSLTVDGDTIEIGGVQGVRDALAFVHDVGTEWLLTDDIDLTGDAAGLYFPCVRGNFDGNGHTITLDIELPATGRVGAIGYTRWRVEELSVEGSVEAAEEVGALLGNNTRRGVVGSSATADVTGNTTVGGLVGTNGGEVTDSSATADVTGDTDVGGLVGTNGGEIGGSTAEGVVSGTEQVGGLVGYNNETVADSAASSTLDGDKTVGGLVGLNGGEIVESTASGTVSGTEIVGGLVGSGGDIEASTATGDVTGDRGVGGLVGTEFEKISNSYYDIEEVSINGEHKLTTGGLFPEQYQDWQTNGKELSPESYDSLTATDGTVEISDAQGVRDALGFLHDEEYDWKLTDNLDLTGDAVDLYFPYVSGEFEGNGHTMSLDLELPEVNQIGAIGETDHTVADLSVEGSVTGSDEVGALVGYSNGEIIDSTANADVTGARSVGGLVGVAHGHLTNVTATGDVTGGKFAGGLVGLSSADITDSTASVTVTGTNKVGGLTGHNAGLIERSVFDGPVSGERAVGGLAGFQPSPGSIQNSVAHGAVTGTERVGGIAGALTDGLIERAVATANIDGKQTVGGLVGYNYRRGAGSGGVVRDSYWDTDTTGQQTALGSGIEITGDIGGLSTEQMQGESAAKQMSALDFEDIWTTRTDPARYPTLRDQKKSQQSADSGDESGPGFGFGVAVGGLSGVAYLRARQRSDESANSG